MRLYTATSNADGAAWLREQLMADDLDSATLDAWEAAVVERFVKHPLPRQVSIITQTDGRLVRAAQMVGIELSGRWPDMLFVDLP